MVIDSVKAAETVFNKKQPEEAKASFTMQRGS